MRFDFLEFIGDNVGIYFSVASFLLEFPAGWILFAARSLIDFDFFLGQINFKTPLGPQEHLWAGFSGLDLPWMIFEAQELSGSSATHLLLFISPASDVLFCSFHGQKFAPCLLQITK